jgi:outer membrane biosynthesis protein TonB
MFGQDGAESFSTVNEVVEFSQATLDASLFDIPAGYREVKDFASAFSTPTTPTQSSESTETQPTTPTTAPTSTPSPQPNKEPKKEENPVKKGLKSLKPKWSLPVVLFFVP